MFVFSRKNRSKASLAHSTIFLVLVVLIASCSPQIPAAGTSTPGIGSTRVSLKDNMTMVFIPAGEFKMGGYVGSTSDSMPVHPVYLDAFWIDQTEVTNEMFAKFVDSTGYVTDAENAGVSNDVRVADQSIIWEEVKGLTWKHPDGVNSNISGLENHPVVHVSWNDAHAYCSWAERRLTTEAEWEKAASWDYVTGEKYQYPWGDGFDQTLVNFCDVNCAYDWATKHLDDGYAETSPVGSFPQGASPYGALDMSGNVLEWVVDWYGEDYYKHSPASNPLGPDSGLERVVRGGAWATNDYYVSSARRWAQGGPSFQHRSLGFRCALGTSP